MSAPKLASSPELREPQATVNRGANLRGLPQQRGTVARILVGGGLSCALLFLPSLQKRATAAPAQPLDESVQLRRAGTRGEQARPPALAHEVGPDRRGSVVELLAPVSPQRDPVPEKDTEKKGQKATQGGREEIDQHAEYRWWLPILTLLAGFAVGGGLSGGRK